VIRTVALLAMFACGCLRADLVACDDGRSCPAGTACTPTGCTGGTTGCGNGAIDDGSTETCDDGNTVAGDGCSSTCELEGCGNAKPDTGEQCDDGNTIAGDDCSATCQRERPHWTALDPVDDERQGMAFAFLPPRGRIVRFGGFDVFAGLRAGTHELVGERWEQITTEHSPTARHHPASAYDSARQRWVLFGGGEGFDQYVSDTWEFDGTDWHEVATSGPPPGMHAMAYDPIAQRVFMYCAGATSETWSFDGAAWQQLPTTEPAQPLSAALAYDPDGQRIVMFGDTQTWQLVGGEWTQVTTNTSPPARTGHALVYDPSLGGVLLQGGAADTWLLVGSTWTQLGGAEARIAEDIGLAFDPARGRTVRYGGGKRALTFSDLFERRGDGWHALPSRPYDRTRPVATTDTQRGRVIVFGGLSWADPFELQDTWAFDGTTWTELATTRRPAYAAGMAYDAARDRVVLIQHDPWSYSSAPAVTWEYDGTDWSDVTSATSTPHIESAIAYDPVRARTIAVEPPTTVDGGSTTYVYDGVTWEVLPVTASPPRGTQRAGRLVYDEHRGVVVYYDGQDLWELDGTPTWTRVTTTDGPRPRFGAALLYHPVRHAVLLTAGYPDAIAANDTWAYDGTTWEQLSPIGGYSGRGDHVMAWLPSDASVVLFGGNDDWTTRADTWFLRWLAP